MLNPTSEDLSYQCGGLSYTVKSGQKRKVNDSEGNHALNCLGARGLTKLEFDDDGKIINEEQIAKDAIERNRQFKIRQIRVYNERNERRKASGQPYDTPTAVVKKYAAELGIELLQGYTMADAEKEQIAKLNKDNSDKDRQLKEQSELIQELMKKIDGISDQVSKGFIRPEKDKDPLVKCPECNKEVLASKLKSHINYYHKKEDTT